MSLKKSMHFLASKKNTIFIGQAVEVPGTAMSNTLKGISKNYWNFLLQKKCKWASTRSVKMEISQLVFIEMEFFIIWSESINKSC